MHFLAFDWLGNGVETIATVRESGDENKGQSTNPVNNESTTKEQRDIELRSPYSKTE